MEIIVSPTITEQLFVYQDNKKSLPRQLFALELAEEGNHTNDSSILFYKCVIVAITN